MSPFTPVSSPSARVSFELCKHPSRWGCIRYRACCRLDDCPRIRLPYSPFHLPPLFDPLGSGRDSPDPWGVHGARCRSVPQGGLRSFARTLRCSEILIGAMGYDPAECVHPAVPGYKFRSGFPDPALSSPSSPHHIIRFPLAHPDAAVHNGSPSWSFTGPLGASCGVLRSLSWLRVARSVASCSSRSVFDRPVYWLGGMFLRCEPFCRSPEVPVVPSRGCYARPGEAWIARWQHSPLTLCKETKFMGRRTSLISDAGGKRSIMVLFRRSSPDWSSIRFRARRRVNQIFSPRGTVPSAFFRAPFRSTACTSLATRCGGGQLPGRRPCSDHQCFLRVA